MTSALFFVLVTLAQSAPVADKLYADIQSAAQASLEVAAGSGDAELRQQTRLRYLDQIVRLSDRFTRQFPADERAGDVHTFRLGALYRAAVLRKQDMAALRESAEATRDQPGASHRQRAAGDYYAMRAELAELADEARPEAEKVQREYMLLESHLDQFPDSPFLATTLRRFAQLAERQSDRPAAIKAYRQLAERFAADPMGRRAAARVRQLEVLGQRQTAELNTAAGQRFTLQQQAGNWTFVAFLGHWASEGRDIVEALADVQSRRQDVRIVVVSLDLSAADLATWQSTWAGGIATTWPTHFDGLQFRTPLAEQWAIRAAPAVCLLDPQGRLVSTEALVDAQQLLFQKPPTTQPAAQSGQSLSARPATIPQQTLPNQPLPARPSGQTRPTGALQPADPPTVGE